MTVSPELLRESDTRSLPLRRSGRDRLWEIMLVVKQRRIMRHQAAVFHKPEPIPALEYAAGARYSSTPMNSNNPALIDIGANLGHSSFQHDLDTVVSQAREAGVAHIIVTGTDLESIEAAIDLHGQHPGYLTCTAGFHPHVASDFNEDARGTLQQLAATAGVVAIGETGLDFNRNYSPRDAQERAFEQQLELACELNKPVFLHQRDAHVRFLDILKTYRDKLPGGVVHCFTDTREALYDYLDLDMYIGITGWICDERRGRELQNLVGEIPQHRLLLETDAPYLLPRSLRPKPQSRRNEPRYLTEVLAMIAHCSGTSREQLAVSTSANARRLFELPDG